MQNDRVGRLGIEFIRWSDSWQVTRQRVEKLSRACCRFSLFTVHPEETAIGVQCLNVEDSE